MSEHVLFKKIVDGLTQYVKIMDLGYDIDEDKAKSLNLKCDSVEDFVGGHPDCSVSFRIDFNDNYSVILEIQATGIFENDDLNEFRSLFDGTHRIDFKVNGDKNVKMILVFDGIWKD